jgi:hypothetical protein
LTSAIRLLGILAIVKVQFSVKVNFMGKGFYSDVMENTRKTTLNLLQKKRGVLASCNLSTHFTITP